MMRIFVVEKYAIARHSLKKTHRRNVILKARAQLWKKLIINILFWILFIIKDWTEFLLNIKTRIFFSLLKMQPALGFDRPKNQLLHRLRNTAVCSNKLFEIIYKRNIARKQIRYFRNTKRKFVLALVQEKVKRSVILRKWP